jgi:hypothetical protein
VAKTQNWAPLRHRDFALLWSGQTISMLGDGIFTVTVALEALRVDHHASGLSYVLAARILPAVVLVLIGGSVVDRVPKRLALLAADTVQGVAVGVVAVLAATGHDSLAALVIMAAAFGAADAFFFPASIAIAPELVPADLLVRASALNSTSSQLARSLLGPAFGGLLVGVVGTAWGFGIDAASFAVGTVCLLFMNARPRPAPGGHGTWRGVVEGLRYVRTQRWLWVSLAAAGLSNFVAFSPLAVLIPLLVDHSLHQGGLALGLVLACGGFGGLSASLVLGHLGSPRRRITFLWLGWGLTGLPLIGLGLAPDIWSAGALAFVVYGLGAYGDILWGPLMQTVVPSDMIGRASSVDYLVSFALSPLGLVAAGAAAEAIGARTTLVIGGAVSAMCTFVPLIPGVRDPDRNPAQSGS